MDEKGGKGSLSGGMMGADLFKKEAAKLVD
jgi:hypothetical protein